MAQHRNATTWSTRASPVTGWTSASRRCTTANDWTAGVLPGKHAHADYHNIYNLEWALSIAKGYADNGETQRPFLLARSGRRWDPAHRRRDVVG